jgi:hypothetical protein
MSILALDGYGSGTAANTATATISLVTANAEDVLILASFNDAFDHGPTVDGYPSGGPFGISGIVDTGGLEWTNRTVTSLFIPPVGGLGTGYPNGITLEVWWAFSAAAYSGTLTVTYANDVDNIALVAFGVTGAGNPRSPWDVNASLPAPTTSVIGTFDTPLANTSGFSTTAPNSFIFLVGGTSDGEFSGTPGAIADTTDGYTESGVPAGIDAGHLFACCATEYMIAGSPQSSLTANFAASFNNWIVIADAIAGEGSAGAARRVFFVA